MQLQRGMRDKLEKHLNLKAPFEVEMIVDGPGGYDFCCFGVDASEKLSDERYMIFYNQVASPQGEITYQRGNASATFFVDLSKMPQNIQKLVFTLSVDGGSTMGHIRSFVFRVRQNGNAVLELNVHGSDFMNEKAIITTEIYWKETWRINAVARGFNGGLGDLLRAFGGEEETSNPTPTPQPVPTPSPQPQPVPIPSPRPQPSKVNLQKGEKVSLVKGNDGLGEILINLNWKQPTGVFSKPIDLDLGCLYELKDGTKGCVQALGNAFGSLDKAPFIALDGDDRSGSSTSGENLRINGQMVSKIKRVLVYTFIYEGIANWKGADGVVTINCPGSPEIIVHMDEYGSSKKMCALAMFENIEDTLCVEKLIEFFGGHRYMDSAYNWGLHWVAGSK